MVYSLSFSSFHIFSLSAILNMYTWMKLRTFASKHEQSRGELFSHVFHATLSPISLYQKHKHFFSSVSTFTRARTLIITLIQNPSTYPEIDANGCDETWGKVVLNKPQQHTTLAYPRVTND